MKVVGEVELRQRTVPGASPARLALGQCSPLRSAATAREPPRRTAPRAAWAFGGGVLSPIGGGGELD